MTAAEALAEEVLRSVPAIMRYLRSRMRANRGPALSVPQLRVLIFVRHNADARLSDLADHLGVALPSASRLVSGLVRRRLLTRVARPADRRTMRLVLTAAGRRAFDQAYQATRQAVAERLAALPARQAADLLAALRRLGELLQTPSLRAVRRERPGAALPQARS